MLPNEDLRYFGLYGLLFGTLAIILMLYKWRGNKSMTLSLHAAPHPDAYLTMGVAAICQILIGWIPDKPGKLSRIHNVLAFIAGPMIIPITIFIALSPAIPAEEASRPYRSTSSVYQRIPCAPRVLQIS